MQAQSGMMSVRYGRAMTAERAADNDPMMKPQLHNYGKALSPTRRRACEFFPRGAQDLLQFGLARVSFLEGRKFSYRPPCAVIVAVGFDDKPSRPTIDDTVNDFAHVSSVAFSYEPSAKGGDWNGSHALVGEQRGEGQQSERARFHRHPDRLIGSHSA